MRTIIVDGSTEDITVIMVPKSEAPYREHDTVRLTSSASNADTEKTIFRIVDAGNDQWELQFE
jgi:hypothetical protein